jgi:hypothetical protein
MSASLKYFREVFYISNLIDKKLFSGRIMGTSGLGVPVPIPLKMSFLL